MARTTTDRLGLQTWTDDADAWDRADFAGNNAALDELVAIDLQGTVGDLFGPDGPDPAIAGQWYHALDLGVVFRSDGERWRAVNAVISAQSVVSDQSDPTTTTAELNEAIAFLSTTDGGGLLYFPAGVYMIEPADPDDPAPWTKGGIQLRPGVSLLGAPGSVLRWAGGPGAAIATVDPASDATPVKITADVASGDTTFTVTSSATFAVGDVVVLRLGYVAADTAEALWWTFATVAAIPDGTHVTLDTPAGQNAAGVADADRPAARSIRRFAAGELVEASTITGLRIEADDPDAGPMEWAVFARYARGLAVRDVVAVNPGAGLGFFYCDGVSLDNVRVNESRVPTGGHAGYGRCLTLGSVRAARVERCTFERFERHAVYLEHGTDLVADTVAIANTWPGRDQSLALTISGLNTRARWRNLRVSGAGSKLHQAVDDASDTATEYEDLRLATATEMLHVPLYALDGVTRLRTLLGGTSQAVDLRPPRQWSAMFPVVPGETVDVPIPQAFIARLRVYLSTTTGVTAAQYIAEHGTTTVVDLDPVADELVEVSAQAGRDPLNVAGELGAGNWPADHRIAVTASAVADPDAYGFVVCDLLEPHVPTYDNLNRGPVDLSHLVRTARLRITEPVATYSDAAGTSADRSLPYYTSAALGGPTPTGAASVATAGKLADVQNLWSAFNMLVADHEALRAGVVALLEDLAAVGLVEF